MTDLLSAADVADLTRIEESAMSETVTITDEGAFTSDNRGGVSKATTTRTTIAHFWSVSGDEAGADQIKARGQHRMTIPKTVSVSATARITRADGTSYQIKYVFPLATYPTSRMLGLEEA